MRITNLEVTPERPIAGEKVTIRAQVNDKTTTATFYVSTNKEDWTDIGTEWSIKSAGISHTYTVPSTSSLGTIYYFKTVVEGGSQEDEDSFEDDGYDSVAVVVSSDARIQPEVPLIDIVFTHDENNQLDMNKRTVTFSHPVVSCLLRTGLPRAATKINRSLSKNVIYINFPTQTENSGGYGYDLGFVEDTFTFTIVTTDWNEYERVFTLCKCNTGEVSGNLHIGKINDFRKAYPYSSESDYSSVGCKTYKVILRSSDADFDPGTFKITYTIKCTIVYNGA